MNFQKFYVPELETLNDYYDKETNSVFLPEPLILTLNSISISTLRGIIYSEFRGTFLQNATLPIIDPKVYTKIDPS